MVMKPVCVGLKCLTTYIHKEAKSIPGFKAFKDHMAVLFGSNAAGCKVKPLVKSARE